MMPSRLRGELYGLPLSRREQDALVAVVRAGGVGRAVADFGASYNRLVAVLGVARAKLGAETTTHAVALAYRRLHGRYELPGDRDE